MDLIRMKKALMLHQGIIQGYEEGITGSYSKDGFFNWAHKWLSVEDREAVTKHVLEECARFKCGDGDGILENWITRDPEEGDFGWSDYSTIFPKNYSTYAATFPADEAGKIIPHGYFVAAVTGDNFPPWLPGEEYAVKHKCFQVHYLEKGAALEFHCKLIAFRKGFTSSEKTVESQFMKQRLPYLKAVLMRTDAEEIGVVKGILVPLKRLRRAPAFWEFVMSLLNGEVCLIRKNNYGFCCA